MDGENMGSNPINMDNMDDLGVKNQYFWKHPFDIL